MTHQNLIDLACLALASLTFLAAAYAADHH